MAVLNVADLGGITVDAIYADDSGISAVVAMIAATNITVPGLISFIAFNMTTIPCFAAVGTAKSELGNKKRFNWTLVFWVVASYLVGAIVYTIGSWWWTLFIWLAVVAGVTCLIVLYNKGKIKIKLPKRASR